MKRLSKRILVLLLCTMLFFASAHSVYANTFTLEVQAAEAVITTEVAAAVIEYLWGVLLTAGLVTTVVSWTDRASQINDCLINLAGYPEITEDMTIAVTVNGKKTEVTYEQYMTYIRHNVVDGTGAVQVDSEVFAVLTGGGGKNGGNKDHLVYFAFGGMLGYAFYKEIMTRSQNSASYDLTEDERKTLDEACGHFMPEEPVTLTDGNTCVIRDYNNDTGTLNALCTYRFEVDQTYGGLVQGNNDLYICCYKEGEEIHPTVHRYNVKPDSDEYYVAVIAPCVQNTSSFLRTFVVGFTGASAAGESYNGMDFDSWRIYATLTEGGGRSGTLINPYMWLRGRECTAFNIYSEFGRKNPSYIYGGMNDNGNYGFGYKLGVYNNGAGEVGFTVHVMSGYESSMPLIVLDDVSELSGICDGLVENWDNSVFANYSGNAGKGVFELPAYSLASENALSNLADAILRGNAGTDAVIDAAQAVDAMRETEPQRLPEIYPDLYPEYLPDADPAEYPKIYPDYDPVSNPHPAPSVLPDPDRVVDNVSHAVTEPEPNPDPVPVPLPDFEGAEFSLSEYFPFCIPFDLIHAFRLLAADAQAPYWEIPLHAEFLGYVLDYTFVIDMSQFEALAKVFRICETIGFCVGLILITRNIIGG